ncbi:NADH-quinone oxidoreductase subunit NuoN [Camelimonas lactis]|uniref:NADH-quinone oxidoreductase subunit N n=1 Tax=Camelimonas lactis TaxID=659006 RepID=A0A4R2GTN7_9HYPH|nr:NADH-quinone oxidoreductase subunit NuoN [Camelimonas lactis]TCO13688.1 NADH-quinone oxidoreductase subunit N [Camelimonas lactis]
MTAAAIFPALPLFLPELLLAGGALALLLIGAFAGPRSTAFVNGMTLLLLIVAGALVAMQPEGRTIAFNGAFVVDGFGRFMKVLALIGAAGALMLSFDDFRQRRLSAFEYPVLVLLSVTGMMVMISAGDLIALYIGLELQSLAIYVICAFDRDSTRSTEAGLKYFVLGALSSGMLLYGASLIYGFTGTVSFAGIAAAVTGAPHSGVIFGLAFLAAGLAFKMSAVPFHMWTPDVYEGAPTPVTAFLASAPKVAAVAITVRVLVGAFPGITGQWQQIIVFVSFASMALGAFAAIGQHNIKRLMAYSSIGHMGFALVGLAAGTEQGVYGVLLYMAIYVAMTLGVFACIVSMRRNGQPVEAISDLAGLSKQHPAMAYLFALLMFSLAGIPPLAGFFAKFYVFAAAIQAKLTLLAVFGILTSVVGAFYYLRIVKVMFFDEPKEALDPMPGAAKLVLALSSIVTVGYFVAPALLNVVAVAAAKTLF